MAVSIHYVYKDHHDCNLRNNRFTGITKGNEEYLDINFVFFKKIYS